MSSVNPKANAVTAFAINSDLKNWLNSVYPNNPPIVYPSISSADRGNFAICERRDDNPLYIYVDRFKLHIMACEDGKLRYYNQFAIKEFSEYIKYIMLVLKSLDMDQKSSQVVLWGYVGKNSPHYHEFYKYINNVTFGDEPEYLNFGYVFDEVPEHQYFDLYSIHLID